MKTIVILVDGMRPDSLINIPEAQDLKKKASYTMEATTVVPSVTCRVICHCFTVLIHYVMVRPQMHICHRSDRLMDCAKC